MATCKGRNVGFSGRCQARENHEGRHWTYYNDATGLPFIAYWVDMYSQVYRVKAPEPTLPGK